MPIDHKKILRLISSYEEEVRKDPTLVSFSITNILDQLKKCCNKEKSAEEFRKIFHNFTENTLLTWRPLFYIAYPRSIEAQLLFDIASLIAASNSKKSDVPILDTYKMLLPLDNDDSYNDIDKDKGTENLILSTHHTGDRNRKMYLLEITVLASQNSSFNKFQNYYPPFYPLGDIELDQIAFKDSKVHSHINSTRKSNPGWLSITTLNKLKTVAEIALSKKGHDSDPADAMKSRYRAAILQDPDFGIFLEARCGESSIAYWENESDTHTLLTHAYVYFRNHLEMLERTNPDEAEAFSRLYIDHGYKLVFLGKTFHECWYQDECMSLAGREIAQFVYEVAPTEMTFFNTSFGEYTNRSWKRASRTELIKISEISEVKEDKKREESTITTTPSSIHTPNTTPITPSFWSSCSRSKQAALVVLPPISIFAALVSVEATLTLFEKSATSLLNNLEFNSSLAFFAAITSVVAAAVEIYLVRQENDEGTAQQPHI